MILLANETDYEHNKRVGSLYERIVSDQDTMERKALMNLELLVSEKVNMEVTNRNTGETLVLKSLLLDQDEESLYLAVPIHRGMEYALH